MMASNENPSDETSEKWSNDSKNGIWKAFYYKKDYRRILPPKRIS